MRRRRRHAPAYLTDPLAPLPEPVLQRRVRQNVSAQTNPVIRQITNQINSRARAGSENISGISQALASQLQGGQANTADIYQRARGDTMATEHALQFGLSAQGAGIDSALAKQIQLSGGDPALVAQMTAATQGAVGAQGTRGSAELGALTLKQAAGEEYASKLPGLAKLSGLQGIRDLQAAKQQELATQLADVRGRVPGAVAQQLSSARQQEYNKAVAARGFGVDYANIGQRQRESNQRTSVSQQNADISARRADETARHNRNLEAIDARGGNQTQARLREQRRHNKVTENISKRKDKAARKKGKKGAKTSLLP
jgi:hypothetical protein